MFRRVTVADAHIPVAPARADHIALLDPPITQRQRVHHVGEIEGTARFALGVDARLHPAIAPEFQRLWGGHGLLVERQHPRHEHRCPRGDQLRAMHLTEPARHAHMIGVVMGQDHAGDGLALEGPLQDRLPDRGGAARMHARIDKRPALPVIQRVDIHVIERHGQRQAQPQDALGHGHRLPLGGRLRPGVPDADSLGRAHAARSSDVIA